MSNIEFILVIALAIPLWMLYHKVFVVFYRDVFWGIIGEIFTAMVTSYILIQGAFSLLGWIVRAVTGFISGLVTFLLGLSVLAICAGVIIWYLTFLHFCRKQGLHLLRRGGVPPELTVPESCGAMARSHWKAAIWMGKHRWGLLIPTAAFCACVLLLVRLLIPGGQTAEPASEGSEVLPDETEFYPEQEADIPTPDTGIYLAFNPYVTHENADGQTMLEQATLVNLYTDDSGMLRGQVYEYLKQDSPVAGDWSSAPYWYTFLPINPDEAPVWGEAYLTFRDSLTTIYWTPGSLILYDAETPAAEPSDGPLTDAEAGNLMAAFLDTSGYAYQMWETQAEYQSRVEAEYQAYRADLVQRADAARTALLDYYASYGIMLPDTLEPRDYYDTLNHNIDSYNPGLSVEEVQTMLQQSPNIAETFGEDVWYYLQEHDYPYTLDEGVRWFPESW